VEWDDEPDTLLGDSIKRARESFKESRRREFNRSLESGLRAAGASVKDVIGAASIARGRVVLEEIGR